MSEIIQYSPYISVFGIAAILLALIVLIRQMKSLQQMVGGGTKPAAASAAAPVVGAAPVQDGELIAVITAAIAVAMEAEASGAEKKNGFVVRSFRRVNNAPAWNRAGREEQVYSRM